MQGCIRFFIQKKVFTEVITGLLMPAATTLSLYPVRKTFPPPTGVHRNRSGASGKMKPESLGGYLKGHIIP